MIRPSSVFLLATALLATALLATLIWPAAGQAQVILEQTRDDVPALATLSPLAVRGGQEVEIELGGERLAGVRGVLCEAVELVETAASEDKSARLRIRVLPETAPGVYPLHLLCEAGLSNPRMIVVDTLPQTVEAEDNNSAEKATAIERPGGASGVLLAGDRDFFRFEAGAGETVAFELWAARIGSPIQGVLTLCDAAGRELQKSAVPPGDIAPDTRLVHTFEQAGSYCVCVTDQTYQGAEFAAYYLRAAPLLYAETIFPLGGRRGERISVQIAGGSLKQPLTQTVDLSGENGEVDWTRRRLEIPTPQGNLLAPLLFAVGNAPELKEQEPNDEAGAAQAVEWPVTVNGRLDKPGDRDCFRIRAKTGEKLVIDLFADRLGCPVDGLLVVKDAKGKTVGEADDITIAERIPPVIHSAFDNGATDDPRLEVTAPGDGDLIVEVRDRYDHGGAALAYRLEIYREQQDFDLLLQPGRVESGNANDRRQRQRARRVVPQFDGRGGGALSIDRGGRGSLVVKVVRRGYQGPIALDVQGLPPGLHVQPATIVAGQNQALVDIFADFDAESAAAFATVTGSAEAGGRRMVRRALQPVVFAGLPLGAVAQQELDTVAVGISGRGAEIALRGTLARPVTPGATALLRVELRRREGIKGDVALRALSPPSGLSVEPFKITDSQMELEVPLVAAADLTPGKRTFQLEGRLTVKGRKEPLVALAPVEIDVQPLVVVELLTQTLEVAPGAAAKLEFRIAQNGAEPVPVLLETSRLPDGVSLAEPTIPADAQTFALQLTASGEARPSPLPRVVQIKPVVQVKTGRAAGSRLELPTQRVVLKIVKP